VTEGFDELFGRSHIGELADTNPIKGSCCRERLDGDVLMPLLQILFQRFGNLTGLKRANLYRECDRRPRR
jgi:hypothetical protein